MTTLGLTDSGETLQEPRSLHKVKARVQWEGGYGVQRDGRLRSEHETQESGSSQCRSNKFLREVKCRGAKETLTLRKLFDRASVWTLKNGLEEEERNQTPQSL